MPTLNYWSNSKAADNPELLAQFQTFVDKNSDSSYALLAAFVAAKEAVAKEDYAVAAKTAELAATTAKQPRNKSTGAAAFGSCAK